MILHLPYYEQKIIVIPSAFLLLVMYMFSNFDLITSYYYDNRKFIKTCFQSQQ